MFSSDVVAALEKYGNELVNSVMERTEAIIRNYGTNVSWPLFFSIPLPRMFCWVFACLSGELMDFVQINVERITGTGDAKDVICSTVGKLGADTLVMGSHGYGFFKRYPPNFPSLQIV